MSNTQIVYEKLAGVLKSVKTLLEETAKGQYKSLAKTNFSPQEVSKYFDLADKQLTQLRKMLPELYEDSSELDHEPSIKKQ